jgi:ribosomal protein S18 acetylase RimI-like enzyme
MDAVSLGFRTELMVRRLAGSQLLDHDDHLVVRTPSNPDYWWGNFLLYPAPPRPADASGWLAAFAAALPEARHLAFGVDTTDGFTGEPSALAALGVRAESASVLTAQTLRPPPPPARSPAPAPAPEVTVRALADDDGDWAQADALRLACDDRPDTETHRRFRVRKLEEARGLCRGGHGSWFGAFIDGALRSSLGVFADGSGLARYQSVETHPQWRRRGLAQRLVHDAGRHALTVLGAHTLVIVADTDGEAIRLYRSLGFADAERQVQLQREPPAPAGE